MNDEIIFMCDRCGAQCGDSVHEMVREYDRVTYRSPYLLDVVDVDDSSNIGTFCSAHCLNSSREGLMAKQNIPIPSVRPDIEPIEQCARCKGPVDMSDWHLTILEDQAEHEYVRGRCEARIVQSDYMAVVCRACAPRGALAECEQNVEIVAAPTH